MGKRLKLRRDHPGEVFIGSYESNQPERISLTQRQPYVDVALRRKEGWNEERINAELPKYLMYIPEILHEEQAPRAAPMPAPKPVPKPALPSPTPPPAPEEDPDQAPLAEVTSTAAADEDPGETHDEKPPEVETPAIPPLPSIQKLKAMNRGDLTGLAEQHGVMDDIVGTGQDGYVTVPNIRDHLIEIVRESRK